MPRMRRHSPVTATTPVRFDEVAIFIASQQFLVARNIRTPASLHWLRPPVAHVHWAGRQSLIRRIVKWATEEGREIRGGRFFNRLSGSGRIAR